MYTGIRVKYPLFPSDSKQTFIILTDYFSKNVQISNVMKIRPVGYELFHANGWTDRHDEANSRGSQFCVRPKKKGGTKL